MNGYVTMKKRLLVLMILAACSAHAAVKVPPGFEILAQGMEERVAVVLAGKQVGLFDATVSLETVQFNDPDKVLAALKLPITSDNPDYRHILKALSAPLARHGELACGYGQANTGCGYLKTDDVGAIYDSSEGSVTLFLRQAWMPENGRQSLYLAADTSNVENAFIHQQDINVIAQDDYSSLYLQGDGALGVTENSYLALDWSLTATQTDDDSDNSADVNNLYYRYDLARRYYLQMGRMDNRTLFSTQGGNFNFNFLPLGAIDGARLGSTLSYLNREQAGQGTPVVVLLSHSSRVDAYRNNQLLGSFYLPAGNQPLDTSLFPNGSYNVELRIYESNQLARTETLPFSKSGGLDDGRIHWFIQGGRISDADTDADEGNAYQAGFRLPLWNLLSLTAGVAQTDGEQSVEGGLELTPDLGVIGRPTLQTSVYHNDSGGRGDSEQLSWSKTDWPSLNLYRYSSDGSQCSDTDNDTNSYAQLGCYENINVNSSMLLAGWNMTLSYMRTENHTDDSTWQNNRSFSDNVLTQTTGHSVSKTWQLSASRAWSVGDWVMNGTLGVFKRDDDGYDSSDNGMYLSFAVNQAPRADSRYRSQSSRLNVDYRNSKDDDAQTTYQVTHDWYWDEQGHKELSVAAGGINSDTVDASISGRIEGDYGNLNGTLSDSYDNQQNDHTTAISGSYSSSFALGRHGLQWGAAGYGEPSSAVLVQVDDIETEDNQQSAVALDARAGGSRSVTLGGGAKALFPLMSYELTDVSVNEGRTAHEGATTTIVSGAGESNVMLLPGKMRVRNVAVEQRFGYVGRLLLPDVARQNLVQGLNSRMLLLSQDGGFTAEMASQASALYLLSGSRFYTCPLVVKKQRNVVRYVGDTPCREINESDLPQAVHDNALAKLKRDGGTKTALQRGAEFR